MKDCKTLAESFREIFDLARQFDADRNYAWTGIADYLQKYSHVLSIYICGAGRLSRREFQRVEDLRDLVSYALLRVREMDPNTEASPFVANLVRDFREVTAHVIDHGRGFERLDLVTICDSYRVLNSFTHALPTSPQRRWWLFWRLAKD